MFSCDKVITIPQYKETSWFNAILMSIFYSQHSRKMLYHHFEGEDDKFSRIMNDIIKHNYIKTEESTKYFKFMRPENILKYMNADTRKLFNIFKEQGNYNFDSKLFLPFFLKSLDKNVLDVIMFNDKYYGNFYSVLEEFSRNGKIDLSKWSGVDSDDLNEPDYIIVHKIPDVNFNAEEDEEIEEDEEEDEEDDGGNTEAMLEIVNSIDDLKDIDIYLKLFVLSYLKLSKSQLQKFEKKLNLASYDIELEGLDEYANEIVFDENTYILDSVILNNDIAGITCKNEHYVYSSQLRKTQNQEEVPCELVKFDWDVNQDSKFCLNSKLCKLDAPTSDVCYSFNDTKFATLIYIKKESKVSESVDRNLSLTSPLTMPSKSPVVPEEDKLVSCENIITIPQTRGTCWFNAILMSIFYSQHSRKLLYHNFEGKSDKFSRIMNDIIKHNYIKSAQSIEYFKFMKPENILKYININKEQLFKHFKANKNHGFSVNTFLPHFLKSFNKKVLDIIIYDKNCYVNFYSLFDKLITKDDIKSDIEADFSKWADTESEDVTDPDYILVHNTTLRDTDAYKTFFRSKLATDDRIEEHLNLAEKGIEIKGLLQLKDNIKHNGNTYVLDSIILDNYNSVEYGGVHAIAGITCKNNRFVYNGWMRKILDDKSTPRTYGNTVLPCELMKFHWDIRKDEKFCLNRKLCNIEGIKQKELCFSFNQLDKITLIYVKKPDIESVDINLSVESPLTLPSLKSNRSDFSELDDTDEEKFRNYLIERKQRRGKQTQYKQSVLKQRK